MLRKNRKSLVTSKEKVLLHLLNYQKYLQDADAPVSVTQNGIAEAIGVGRNNVSKIVNELCEEGMVEVHSRHVKGHPTKRKVYFLTHNGIRLGLEIKEEIEGTEIVIVDFDGEEHREEFSRINRYLPKRYGLIELVDAISRGRFECPSFHESKVKEERSFIDFTDRKPTVRNFYGREAEFRKLQDLVSDTVTKVIVVHGIPGIGKTTLLAKFAQEARYDDNVFWFRIHEWTSAKVLLDPLAEFLSQLGKKGLERYLSQTEVPSVAEVCPILENDMAGLSAILILDDVQKADDGVEDLLRGLVSTVEQLEGVGLLCTSRTLPGFYSRNLALSGTVKEMQIQGLDRESSIRLLEDRKLPRDMMEGIVDSTGGHPLFLELMDRPGGSIGKDMRLFLEQEVFSKLELTERRILEIASVFRFPVFVDSFFDMEEEIYNAMGAKEDMGYADYMLDYDTIDSLLSKSLLMESMGRMLSMHDLIREFVYSRLHPRQRKLYHKAAAKYYLQEGTASSSVEALFHSLKASEHKNAIRIAAGNGSNIISKGLAIQFAPLLDEVVARCEMVGKSERMELLLLQGEIAEIRGNWEKGLDSLRGIQRIASPETDRRLLAEVNRRMGAINLKRANLAAAEEFLERSLTLAEGLVEPSTLIDINYDLGGLALQKGTFAKALEHFERARDLSSSIGDDIGMGKAIYGVGRTYELLKDHHSAIEAKRRALEVLEKAGDIATSAKVYTGLGNDLRYIGDFDEGLRILEMAIDLSTKAGDINTLGYALSNKAAIHIETGDYDVGGEVLENARNIFEKLDNSIMLSTMHLYKGSIHSERRHWEWAKDEYERSLGIIREAGAPNVMAQTLLHVGTEFVENGDPSKGRALLQEARTIAMGIGADKLTKEIEDIIGNLGEAS